MSGPTGAERPTATAPEPDFGPSLPDLVRRWSAPLARWQRIAIAVVVAAILLAPLGLLFQAEVAKRSYIQTGRDAQKRGLPPLPFHFDYTRRLDLSKPAGAYVEVSRSQGGTLVARMRVSPIRLRTRPGVVSGYLPILAVGLERRAAREHPGFKLQFEGRSRVNFDEGYQFAFNARLRQPGRSPRLLFGRQVILPEPYDNDDPAKPYPPGRAPTRGVLIQMESTTLDSTELAHNIGDTGILRKPFRSFRFGS